MTNPDIGIYSNNNYVPDIGQFGHQPDIINNYTPMQNNQGGCNYPGNFTFAVPTSANQLTAGFTQTSQPAGLYSNTYMNPQQVVPGMGATWQHTVPNYMPWTDQVYGMVNSGISRVSTFTGNSTVSQSYNTVPSPRPSCSGPARRNKRHATEDIEAGSPENKIFLTEEKMADRMQSLNIGTRNLSPPPIQPLPDVVLSSNMDAQYCKEAEGLQRLKELEKRLEDDVSESRDRENKRKEKPKLRLKLNLPEKVTASIFNPSPILPKKILEDINNSNLQVVLWKPPLGRPANSEEKSHDQDTTDNDIDEPVIAMAEQDSDTLPSSPLFSLPEEDIDMDEDTMDLD